MSGIVAVVAGVVVLVVVAVVVVLSLLTLRAIVSAATPCSASTFTKDTRQSEAMREA